jgi:GT2 family glycosyltransferase
MDKKELHKQPLVFVITLNWNSKQMTIDCIHSVLKSEYRNFKVFVVDNGSTDGSVDSLRKEFGDNITILESDKNLGYVKGMNYGLENTILYNPDYFLIMNNDTHIDSNAMHALVKCSIKHNNKCLVTGKVYHYERNNIIQTVGSYYDLKTLHGSKIGYNEEDGGQYDKEEEREMIDDIFMLLPSEVYRIYGGYSPYFSFNCEQSDLIMRIKKAGYKVYYTPDAKIWHKGSFSSGGIGNPYMMFWEGKSRIILHRLHQSNYYFYPYYIKYVSISFYNLLKGIVGYVIGRSVNLKSRYAKFRGVLSGTWWLFRRNYENGYNPFAAKK